MMKNLTNRLLLDIACWTALTTLLVMSGYVVAGGIVGGFAAVYILNCIKKLVMVNKAIKAFNNHLNDE